MGDVRFDAAYANVRDAQNPDRALELLTDEEVVAALAAASKESDEYVANVIATAAMNRMRHSAAVFEHLAEGVVLLDEDGRIRRLNPAGERALMWAQEEVLGKDFHELVDHRHGGSTIGGDALWQRVSREDCEILRALAGGGHARVIDHDGFVRRDGTLFVAAYTVAPVEREREIVGAVVVFRDVTDEMRERDSLELFRAAVDGAAEAIVWVNPDASFRYANPAACDALGYTRDEMLRMTVHEIDPEYGEDVWREHWQKVKELRTKTIHTTHRTKSGELVPVRVRINHVELRGHEFHCAYSRYDPPHAGPAAGGA